MHLSLAAVPDQAIDRLVVDTDRQGYGCLSDHIPPTCLTAMRSFVSSATGRSNGERIGFTGAASVAGSTLDMIAASPEFQRLVKNIYQRGTGREAPAAEFYQVLRYLSGRSVEQHSLRFHYESYVVIVLIPVEIPTSGRTGDLVMLPNTRGIRRSYLANVPDKLMLDSAMTQFLLKSLMKLKLLPLVRINPVPGNIHFFRRYRSIHTDEACDPDKVRVTALFDFANPHVGDRLQAKLRRRKACGPISETVDQMSTNDRARRGRSTRAWRNATDDSACRRIFHTRATTRSWLDRRKVQDGISLRPWRASAFRAAVLCSTVLGCLCMDGGARTLEASTPDRALPCNETCRAWLSWTPDGNAPDIRRIDRPSREATGGENEPRPHAASPARRKAPIEARPVILSRPMRPFEPDPPARARMQIPTASVEEVRPASPR